MFRVCAIVLLRIPERTYRSPENSGRMFGRVAGLDWKDLSICAHSQQAGIESVERRATHGSVKKNVALFLRNPPARFGPRAGG